MSATVAPYRISAAAYSGFVEVQLLYFDDCPNWRVAAAHLDELRDEFDLRIERVLVESPETAEELGFLGSPSIVAAGNDMFAASGGEAGLSCRVYQTPEGPAGSPTLDQVRHALRQLREGA